MCSQDLLNPYFSWRWLLGCWATSCSFGFPTFPDQQQLPHQLNGSVSHTPVYDKDPLQVHEELGSLRGHLAIWYFCSATSSSGGSRSAVWDEPKCLMITCAACRFNVGGM